MGVFTYSHEEGTIAHDLPDDISEELKQQRMSQLMESQQEISFEKNVAKIGKTYRVLFDRKEGDYFVGRTQYDSPEVDNEVLVSATDNTYLRIGDFADVSIVNAEPFDLIGKLVKGKS